MIGMKQQNKLSKHMKIALVYDRINKWGGAERVLLELHKIFPEAPLYTSVYDEENAKWAKVFPEIRTSFLQKLPFIKSHHEYFPYLMPLAFEGFNFDGFDIVISVTSEYAKAIITKPETLHICYCLTPTRYLWSEKDLYLQSIGQGVVSEIAKFFARPVLHSLRMFDQIAASRPDYYLSISNTVAKRVKKYYQLDSQVIFPPVDTKLFKPKARKAKSNKPGDKYFLIVSRLVPYKRIDLAIETFNQLGWKLIIIGNGSDGSRLKSIARSNIEFIGKLTDGALLGYYQNCEALIFCSEEDFGLTSLEAQACGKPVIAYKNGGVGETVIEGKTGVFFKELNSISLGKALKTFGKLKFLTGDCVDNAVKYNAVVFRDLFKQTVEQLWKQRQIQTGTD